MFSKYFKNLMDTHRINIVLQSGKYNSKITVLKQSDQLNEESLTYWTEEKLTDEDYVELISTIPEFRNYINSCINDISCE